MSIKCKRKRANRLVIAAWSNFGTTGIARPGGGGFRLKSATIKLSWRIWETRFELQMITGFRFTTPSLKIWCAPAITFRSALLTRTRITTARRSFATGRAFATRPPCNRYAIFTTCLSNTRSFRRCASPETRLSTWRSEKPATLQNGRIVGCRSCLESMFRKTILEIGTMVRMRGIWTSANQSRWCRCRMRYLFRETAEKWYAQVRRTQTFRQKVETHINPLQMRYSVKGVKPIQRLLGAAWCGIMRLEKTDLTPAPYNLRCIIFGRMWRRCTRFCATWASALKLVVISSERATMASAFIKCWRSTRLQSETRSRNTTVRGVWFGR